MLLLGILTFVKSFSGYENVLRFSLLMTHSPYKSQQTAHPYVKVHKLPNNKYQYWYQCFWLCIKQNQILQHYPHLLNKPLLSFSFCFVATFVVF